ncbi:hypothetical protein SDC9_125704 [bioreactor metagenome]|uniref:Uncharacterized protein n=1 Tax=bioreactor metagenome TaxID=1076179 RepID=A0A645CP39_9ZZZZ
MNNRTTRCGKKIAFLLCLAISIFCSSMPASAADTLQQKIDERTTVIWIEGEALGDMVIGARAQVAFIYVDESLSKGIVSDPHAPDWLKWHASHFSNKELRNRALFVMRYKTIKRWDFSPENIKVGTHNVDPKDILTNKDFMAMGDLPPDTIGTLAFSVPSKYVIKGRNVELSYEQYTGVFNVPKR